MSRWRRINRLLKSTSELYLFYLPSFVTDHWFSVVDRDKYPSGIIGRCIAYLSWFLKRVIACTIRKKQAAKDSLLLFYADTENQKVTLSPIAHYLSEMGVSTCAVGRQANDDDTVSWIPRRDSVVVLFLGLFLALIRGRRLFASVKSISCRLADETFDEYLKIYCHLFYFDSLLNQVNPKLVLIANDHKVTMRCLLATCRARNIEVVYMQHGFVSSIFPPLDMHYAFLDGEVSENIYSNCEENIPKTLRPQTGECKVYLNGCKKKITRKLRKANKTVGIGLSKGNDQHDTSQLIKFLLANDYSVKCRSHPMLSDSDFIYLKEKFGGNDRFSLTKANEQSLNDFLNEIFILVAGDTTLLLDNALSDGVSIYYQFNKSSISKDYYGFVAKGVALELKTIEGASDLFNSILKSNDALNNGDLKNWSSTYGTIWQGREDELSVTTILSIIGGGKEIEDQ